MRCQLSVCAVPLAAIAVGFFSIAPAYAQTPAPPPAAARHVVGSSALRAAVQQKVAADTADRDSILTAVHRTEARDVARRLGLTPTRLDDAVQTMSAAEVAALAPTARMANDAQAGGDISISLTALLLLLILLVLVVK